MIQQFTSVWVTYVAVDDLFKPFNAKNKDKTDPFHWEGGVDLLVGRSGLDLCLVAALVGYLTIETCSLAPYLYLRW